MAKRRNDEDENVIRRHFDSSLKAPLSCSLVAEGFTWLIAAMGQAAKKVALYEKIDGSRPGMQANESYHKLNLRQEAPEDPPHGGDRILEARTRRQTVLVDLSRWRSRSSARKRTWTWMHVVGQCFS